MKTATVTEFRSKAKEFLQEVEDDQDILILSKPKSREGFVVLTIKQYETLQETAHLLSTKANTKHLIESMAQHKTGRTSVKKLIEPKRQKVRAKK